MSSSGFESLRRSIAAPNRNDKMPRFLSREVEDRQIGNHRSTFMDLMIISSLLMGGVTDATHPECKSAAEIEKLDCRQV
jgi:hypothetical protein